MICYLIIILFPFVLPALSSATEKPLLIQPARILAGWNTLWLVTLIWGIYVSAKEGEFLVQRKLGEYFMSCGKSATRQWLEIWLALECYLLPLAGLTALICHLATSPKESQESIEWMVLNVQYATIFSIATAPLIGVSIALATRFGGMVSYSIVTLFAVYGLYCVPYLSQMMVNDPNVLLEWIWILLPHYQNADLTQRLYYKSGSLRWDAFFLLALYFLGWLLLIAGIARLVLRVKK